MYKQRFHQWDFRKNLKAGEVKKFKGLTAAGQETHLPIVHGRKLGSKRLKSLVIKSNQSLSRSPEAESSHAATPLPGLIDAPEDLRLAEASFKAVVSYSRSQMASPEWGLGDHSKEKTGALSWIVGMELAAYKIGEKKDLATNFQVLNKCCDEYQLVLRRQDPLLIWATYNAILHLSLSGEELAMSFAKLAAGLSLIHFGRSHPLTVLWTNIRRMNMQGVRRAAVPIFDAQFDLFRSNEGLSTTFWPTNVRIPIKRLHDLGLLSPQAAHEKLNECIQWIQKNPFPDADEAEAQLNATRMFKACIHLDDDEYTEADALLRDVELWVETGTPEDKQRVNCAEIRAELDSKMGRLESAEFHYKKALQIAQDLLWQTDPGRIGFSFSALENFYLDHGRIAAAQSVRQGYNMHLKSMVGEQTSDQTLLLEDTKYEDDISPESD
jgi:tetratricopeptide (TPR) repeat protein